MLNCECKSARFTADWFVIAWQCSTAVSIYACYSMKQLQRTGHLIVKRQLFALLNVLHGKQSNPWQAQVQVVDVHSVQRHIRITLQHTNSSSGALQHQSDFRFDLFFSFSFVLVLQYFFVLVLVLPVICLSASLILCSCRISTCWWRRVDDLPKYHSPLVTDSTPYGRSTRKRHIVC